MTTVPNPELTVLVLAALLQCLQYLTVAIPANLELGTVVTTGPRDEGPLADRVSRGTGRLARAMANHFEALVLFTIAALAVTLTGKTGLFSQISAWTYLGARILYVPAYYFGWAPWRSIIWAVGFIATVALLLTALL